MHPVTKIFLFIFLISTAALNPANAQTVDTAVARQMLADRDTITKPSIPKPAPKKMDNERMTNPNARIPRVAAIRSAILPGWGQVYNKKLWKVPIVYAAIGFTGGLFINNYTWYKRSQYAYTIAYNIIQKNDSTGYNKINPEIKRALFQVNGGVQPEWLRTNRDYYKKNRDYAAIYFVIAWALNVVDATVDAHLSSFDISPDLSFRIEPGFSEMARTAGMSFVLKIK